MAFCPKCGEKVKEDYNLCPKCGYPLSENNQVVVNINSNTEKKKTSGCLIFFIVFISIIIVITAVSCGLSFDAKHTDLEITNSNGNVNEYGQLTWEGDITNKGTSKISNIKIVVTCYTPAREAVGKAYTKIQFIQPNETLHFTATGLSTYAPDLSCEVIIL